MGGTRFVGKALVRKLLKKGYELTLFTRGMNPVPLNTEHLVGDRNSTKDLLSLKDRTFDVIIDSSGRRLNDTKMVLDMTGSPRHRFIYVSSAGIYKESFLLPLSEESDIDQRSRHFGKIETEEWLRANNIPFTSFRPTYIYGPGNYNRIEEWFFDRILHNRPIPIPGDGSTITQLGHVDDLAQAMSLSLESNNAINKVYNCSGKRAVTFIGLIHLSAIACGKDPESLSIKPYDFKGLDPKSRKTFPLRMTNFFTDISNVQADLNWTPEIDLLTGLKDSYTNDYATNKKLQPDFSGDDHLFDLLDN